MKLFEEITRLDAKPTNSLLQTMRNYSKVSLLLSKKMGLSEKKMREFPEITRLRESQLIKKSEP